MKSIALQSYSETPLKVVKSASRRPKSIAKRIYINTLIPGFSYVNKSGEIINPLNCVLL